MLLNLIRITNGIQTLREDQKNLQWKRSLKEDQIVYLISEEEVAKFKEETGIKRDGENLNNAACVWSQEEAYSCIP